MAKDAKEAKGNMMKIFDTKSWQKESEEKAKKNHKVEAIQNETLKLRGYKFKAESREDIAKLLKQKDFSFRKMTITMATMKGGTLDEKGSKIPTPDVDVETESVMRLSEIQKVMSFMSCIEDGHVMEESVNYSEKYTKERRSNPRWESEGEEEEEFEEKAKKNRKVEAVRNETLKLRGYKFKAESREDIAKLLKQKDFSFRKMAITTETMEGGKLDEKKGKMPISNVDVEMESAMSLSEIQKVMSFMSCIQDEHIMEESVNYSEKYTGERRSNPFWES
jgi:hypothetical protein